MVNSCAVCGFRATKGSGIKLHRLPLKKPKALKCLLQCLTIYKENIPVNEHTRVCSQHFVGKGQRSKVSKTGDIRSSKSYGENKNSQKFTELLCLADACEIQSKLPSNLSLLSDVCSAAAPLVNLQVPSSDVLSRPESMENSCLSESCNKETQTQSHKSFNIQEVLHDDKKLKYFTGCRDKEIFSICIKLITCGQIKESSHHCLALEEQFLLVLIKLRLGITDQFLAYIFNVSLPTVGNIFHNWVHKMYRRFKLLNIWPNKEEILNSMPISIASKCPNLRVIIDCTDFKIPRPKNPVAQQLTFSSYKNCNTAKALIGISPTGAVCFISELYGGSISDKELTRRSGIVEYLQPGDLMMADRGFLIEEFTKPHGIKLSIPDFHDKGEQFTPFQVSHSRRVSNIRIHVERAIGRIKQYKILNQINSTHMLPDLNKIFYICCILSNLDDVLIK